MSSRTRFPNGIVAVGAILAVLGLLQAVYFIALEWDAAIHSAQIGSTFSGAKFILYVHALLSMALVVIGIGLMARLQWAWTASLALLFCGALTSGFEITSPTAKALQKATSSPELFVAEVGIIIWLVLTVVLIRMRPRLAEPASKTGQVEKVDARAMAALEATKKLSSRKTEDWGEGDDEELLESLVWMTQVRQKDISGRTDEQTKARKEEMDKRIERLPMVIDASPMAIAVGNKLGKVTLWNAAAQRLLGFTQLEMLGEPLPLGDLADGVDPSDLLARVASDGSVMGIGSRQTTKAGTVVPVSMSISVLPDIAGGVGGFMLVMGDLSNKAEQGQGSEMSEVELAGLTDEEWATSAHGQHARRVTLVAELVARELGFSEQDASKIGRASMPHDIGKVGVSGEVWNKTGRLTDEEFDKVKTHTKIGGDMLSSTQSPLLKMAADIAYSHHERWDGYGYLGLRGDEIPIGARIVAVADAFDALTHDRPYRAARTVEHAAAEIRRESGNQFDPRVVDAFLKLLESGRLDIVTADAPTAGGVA
jgi:putative two-component system response regulator